MNNEQLHRDLGRVEGTLKALSTKVEGMDAKLDAVLARQYRRMGAMGVICAIASFAAAWFTK